MIEKRHFTENTITKIINANEISDFSDILKEQACFYKLYMKNPEVTENLENEFFDNTNPFIEKLIEENSLLLEGNLQREECLAALNQMKNHLD